MCYNRLSEEGFENNQICLFIKILEYGFAIVAVVYVDDLNLAGTP